MRKDMIDENAVSLYDVFQNEKSRMNDLAHDEKEDITLFYNDKEMSVQYKNDEKDWTMTVEMNPAENSEVIFVRQNSELTQENDGLGEKAMTVIDGKASEADVQHMYELSEKFNSAVLAEVAEGYTDPEKRQDMGIDQYHETAQEKLNLAEKDKGNDEIEYED